MTADPGPTPAIAYSKLLKPYSTRRLSEALYHVNATANSLHQRELAILIDTPVMPGDWVFAVDELQTDLFVLVQASRDAWRRLDLLKRSAHGDYERALEAVVCMLRGLAVPDEVAA